MKNPFCRYYTCVTLDHYEEMKNVEQLSCFLKCPLPPHILIKVTILSIGSIIGVYPDPEDDLDSKV